MTELEKNTVYEQIQLMGKYTHEPEVSKEELFAYLDEPQEKRRLPEGLTEKNREIRDRLISMMQIDTEGAELLKDQLPEVKVAAEQRTEELKIKAREEMLLNVKNNRELREAKEKLRELEEKSLAAGKERKQEKGEIAKFVESLNRSSQKEAELTEKVIREPEKQPVLAREDIKAMPML